MRRGKRRYNSVLPGAQRLKSHISQSMRDNGVQIASSNGDSADQVVKGTAQFALVDSDGVCSRKKQGQPVEGA